MLLFALKAVAWKHTNEKYTFQDTIKLFFFFMLVVLFHDISQNLHKDNSLLFPNQAFIDLIDFHLFKYKLELL